MRRRRRVDRLFSQPIYIRPMQEELAEDVETYNALVQRQFWFKRFFQYFDQLSPEHRAYLAEHGEEPLKSPHPPDLTADKNSDGPEPQSVPSPDPKPLATVESSSCSTSPPSLDPAQDHLVQPDKYPSKLDKLVEMEKLLQADDD